jgi:hypothetical protein
MSSSATTLLCFTYGVTFVELEYPYPVSIAEVEGLILLGLERTPKEEPHTWGEAGTAGSTDAGGAEDADFELESLLFRGWVDDEGSDTPRLPVEGSAVLEMGGRALEMGGRALGDGTERGGGMLTALVGSILGLQSLSLIKVSCLSSPPRDTVPSSST